VNQILVEAIELRATDVHFEPFEDQLRVRYRVDGVLQQANIPQQIRRFQPAIVSRLKILSHLDIAEKRLPQDGRIKLKIAGCKIDAIERKILNIRDPVEYQLRGVNQIQVNVKSGLSFASGLRSILRHDPDVVLIGEIRDRETAEIAVQASLTGHLVFSTLHTNDAPGAATRLIDMGVEPYLVASSLEVVVAQRLVRVICPQCRQE